MKLIFPVEVVRELWKRMVNIATGVQDVGPEAGAAMVRAGARVLDVREPEEWARGIIPGSVLVPLGQLGDRLAELEGSHSASLLVVCHGGRRSATACRLLRRAGLTKQVNLAGGILAWSRAGFDLEPVGGGTVRRRPASADQIAGAVGCV